MSQPSSGTYFLFASGIENSAPTLEGGRVQQSNFPDYRVMRMNEMPKVEVILMPSGDAPGGIGEPGTAAAAPALTNALFAATGQRIRKLPVAGQLKGKAA